MSTLIVIALGSTKNDLTECVEGAAQPQDKRFGCCTSQRERSQNVSS